VHFYRQGLLLEQQSVLEVEKVRSHSLLKNILPETIIDQLQHGQNLVAAQFEEVWRRALLWRGVASARVISSRPPRCSQVTILFSDLVKFTELSAGLSARSLLWFLNDKFSRFDELTNEFDVYKVRVLCR
jgi:adenylate cyclase